MTTIQINQNDINNAFWPWVLGVTGATYQLTEHVTINDNIGGSNGYFIIGANDITFDGNGFTVTINISNSYPGLIRNGTSTTNGKGNITIKNVGVISIGDTSLLNSGGWIGQRYFSKGVTGCQAYNCYSTGLISSTQSGGIFGANSSYCNATNCYSTGEIGGSYTGGIFGDTGANCIATNCYSTGAISGTQTGGIFGRNSSSCTATNCYSVGTISGTNAGGIFGSPATSSSAINCYSVGINSANGIGPIGVTITNCFAEADGVWKDTKAITILDGEPILGNIGTIWVDYDLGSTSIPYRLASFNRNPYNADGSTGIYYYPISLLSSSLPRGYTGFGQTSPDEYSIIGINNTEPMALYINMDNSGYYGDTGTINFINGLTSNTYDIVVMYYNSDRQQYSFGVVQANYDTGGGNGICFEEMTSILMANGEMKCIKDIQRGEYIITNKETGECAPVARNLNIVMYGNLIKIPKNLIGNTDEIICTENHPIWINNNQNRVYPKNIRGFEKLKKSLYKVYNLQLEEESTFYVHGVRVDSLSPYHAKTPLSKELFFNPDKYIDNYVVKNEDDERRNKPKLVKHYMPLKNKILYF